MGVLYEYTGVVEKVCEIERFDSGFQKQKLIVTDDIGANNQYPNLYCFEFKKDRVDLLKNVTQKARVKVTFAIDGREWTDANGKTRYYTDLTALKLDVLMGGLPEVQKPVGVVETPPPESGGESDDMPF